VAHGLELLASRDDRTRHAEALCATGINLPRHPAGLLPSRAEAARLLKHPTLLRHHACHAEAQRSAAKHGNHGELGRLVCSCLKHGMLGDPRDYRGYAYGRILTMCRSLRDSF
jgi:hypothetical protein